jgi:RNA polymerase sigma-70 factor, ECF subfamily
VTTLSQQALIERFEQWFAEEMPRLYRYLCYQTNDQSVAEEITSIACEKAITRLDQYDPQRGDMRVWLFGIVRNELREYYRSRKQRNSLISLDSVPEFTLQAQSPEQEFQAREAFGEILQTLAGFPEREQEVIALRYGATLSVQEIARIMGMRENHVSVLLHRTIEKLKQSQVEVSYERKPIN